ARRRLEHRGGVRGTAGVPEHSFSLRLRARIRRRRGLCRRLPAGSLGRPSPSGSPQFALLVERAGGGLKHDALRLDSGPPVRSHLRDRVRPPAHRLLTGLTNHTHTRPERGALPEGSTMPRKKTFRERLFAKIMINRGDPGACWMWTGATERDGYGLIWDGTYTPPGSTRLALGPRAIIELYHRPIPDGKQLDHICHVRRCANPEHLRPVTSKQNNENLAGAQRNNRSSGVRGVYWHKQRGKWQAQVQHNGRLHSGGLFDSIDEAAEAARALRLRLFTHNDADRKETAA